MAALGHFNRSRWFSLPVDVRFAPKATLAAIGSNRSRYELADHEWTTIKPMLPNKPRGLPRVNDRRVRQRHPLGVNRGCSQSHREGGPDLTPTVPPLSEVGASL
jgi:hypothetical protein